MVCTHNLVFIINLPQHPGSRSVWSMVTCVCVIMYGSLRPDNYKTHAQYRVDATLKCTGFARGEKPLELTALLSLLAGNTPALLLLLWKLGEVKEALSVV